MNMSFRVSTDRDVTILRIEGALDAMSVSELRPTIEKMSQEHPKQVRVDLSALRLIDSSGVGALVALYKAVRAYGGTMVADGVQAQPLAILRLLRLENVLMAQKAP